ncbi:ABC transporter permease [Salipaludibacillus sp. LMS25]|jgi:putative ABC transport system permease protein|uniref:ABC transporter permease n=1 Tax=Salipaludibacillus sp. LMS25 TaxID=2924031 RepID=UPI0020D00BD4|nr:ABC transporter permease [Salipaludibacillus sp. LMS25]UTR15686.1 ABC transporter permease [Salipaludibacillus sp. LMS25]
MNFIKRGLLGITRKKGKSLILLAVIFILGNLISGAISIQQATDNVETTIKERLGTAATIEVDYEILKAMSDSEMMDLEISDIKINLIKQIGELSYVKYYDYSMSTHIGSESIESYQGEEMEEEEIIWEGPSMDFMLKGINFAPVIDFEEQKGKLVEGRVFTTDEVENGSAVAIISNKLAEKNNLQVGDTFTLNNEIYDYSESSGEDELIASRDVVLEIIGLFEPQSAKEDRDDTSDNGMIDFMDMDYQNTVYVPNEVVSSEERYYWEEHAKVDGILLEEEDLDYYQPIFFLNNQEDTEAFKEEVMPLLPELYTVVNASDQYESIAAPIESMSTISGYVLLVAVIATVLIIGLVVLLFLRDRKRELGIYLSLGERRSRVVGQILIEVMIIGLIGITLSLFSGNFLAQGVSDTMLKADHDQFQEDTLFFGDFETDLTTEDVMDSYQVKLDANYMIMFYVVGLLTILLSTVIPLTYIVRLNPKKIMM